MDEQIEKLINSAGGTGRYQVIILLIGFFIWNSLSLHSTSLPMLEAVPTVVIEGENTTKKLDYKICEGNYTIEEEFGFSWISEMGIECDKAKVGLIGMITYSGIIAGTFLFSTLTKCFTHRSLISFFIFIYVIFAFSTTVIDDFYYRLCALFCLGIANGIANMSIMTLISESVCSQRRSLFQSIINAGYSCCPIMYTPLYVYLAKWRYIFWMQNIIAFTCGVMCLIILENSARMYFAKNETEEAIEVLRRVAALNGELENFEGKIKDSEFDNLLRNEQEGIEKDLTIEMKPQYGYSALLKYHSIRYKFLIFTFMYISTTFLYNAVLINTKSMKGNTYIIIMSLFGVEVFADIFCGFIINFPKLGRKRSLIGFFVGITLGFILTLASQNDATVAWLSMVLIRFCITSVLMTLYVYSMENYPTPIRSLGFGLNSAFGNIAGILSPLIIEFSNKYILYAIFAGLTVINIILTFFLKETVGKPMLETIEELDVSNLQKEKLVPGKDNDDTYLDKEDNNNDKNQPLVK